MQFVDLAAQQSRIRESLEARIRGVLDHGRYILGPEVSELERALEKLIGIDHCLTVASGTDALMMSLMAYDVGPGDAVLTTPFTFIATAEVIRLLGARPVFVDIEEGTYNIDPAALEREIETARNAGLHLVGLIGVDLFGVPARWPEIERICRDNGLFVIEDAAQALGATLGGTAAGTFGDIGTTSFFPAKPLGCYGDGGAVFVRSEDLRAKLESIRVHGKGRDKYQNDRIGVNGRLDTLQAAILLEKLTLFPEELVMRSRIAERYTNALSNFVDCPRVPEGSHSSWAVYTIAFNDRDRIRAALDAAHIPSAVYYECPLHLQRAFSDMGYGAHAFPVSERVAKRVLSLPVHPYLSEEDVGTVIKTIIGAID